MVSRSVSSSSLVRLLGEWRDDARAGGGGDPLYVQLAQAIRLLVLDGRVPLDVRIPGERELAAALGVSRTTVSAAVARLREQGHLVSRHGAGSRTSVPGDGAGPTVGALAVGGPTDLVDLGPASPPADPAVHAAYAAAIDALPAHLPGHGYEPLGLPGLRAVIAERYTRRGLPTRPEEVLVTIGAQHGLALVLQYLTGPGDRVQIDHPTFAHAIDAIQRASCRPVPVGMPRSGWDVDGLVATMRQTGPRLVYLVADFHNPTGQLMQPDERAAVVAAAAATRTTLVVDETMVDLGLDEVAPPPVAAHGRGADVITLGSMSKSVWGGLRIGWIRADAGTISAIGGLRPGLDLGTPVVEQLAAGVLLADDDQRLAARVVALRDGRAALREAIAEELPGWRPVDAPGGLSLWVELPAPVSSALAASAERHGVRVVAGPRFGVDGAFERFVRLPYARPADELRRGVRGLAAAYADLRVPVGASRPPATPASRPTTLV